VNRRFRLKKTADIKRVRYFGKSTSHPLVVLVGFRNNLDKSRIAVTAGKSVGKAVQRNRAKRIIRQAVYPYVQLISPGWDLLFIARNPITHSTYHQVENAIKTIMERAGIFQIEYDV